MVAGLLPFRWKLLSLLFIVASEHLSLSSFFRTLGVLNGFAIDTSLNLLFASNDLSDGAVFVFFFRPLIFASGEPVSCALFRIAVTVCLLIPNSSAIATLVIFNCVLYVTTRWYCSTSNSFGILCQAKSPRNTSNFGYLGGGSWIWLGLDSNLQPLYLRRSLLYRVSYQLR